MLLKAMWINKLGLERYSFHIPKISSLWHIGYCQPPNVIMRLFTVYKQEKGWNSRSPGNNHGVQNLWRCKDMASFGREPKQQKKVWCLSMIIDWTFPNSPLKLVGVLKKEELFHCLEEKQAEIGSSEFWYSQFLLNNTDLCVSPILSPHTTAQHLAEIFQWKLHTHSPIHK